MRGVLSSSVAAAPCVLQLPDATRQASALPRTPRPLSPEKGGIPPPRHPTLLDQSYPCLPLRESRSSPQPYPPAIFIHYLDQDALGGILRGESKSTAFALRSQKRSLASREQPQGAAEGTSRSTARPILLPKPEVWKPGY